MSRLISIIFMFLIKFKVAWCCQMTKAGVIACAIMATLSSFASLFAGIWMITEWKESCRPFTLIGDDGDNYYNISQHDDNYYDYYDDSLQYYVDQKYDDCNEVVWGAVAFVQCVLWTLCAILLWHVICSGKFDAMVRENEERESHREQTNAIEMGTVNNGPPAGTRSDPEVATAVMLPKEEVIKNMLMTQV
jgi:hypothetical protein